MKFVFSGTLLRFVNYCKEVPVEAETIHDAFDLLVKQYPQVKPVLFASDGKVRQAHRLFLNHDLIFSEELASQHLNKTDQVEVLTAIAGG